MSEIKVSEYCKDCKCEKCIKQNECDYCGCGICGFASKDMRTYSCEAFKEVEEVA
jgi:hypothetical protein